MKWQQQRQLAFKDLSSEIDLIAARIRFVIFVILVFIVLVLLRLFFLTTVEHGYYTQLLQKNETRLIPIAPPRGLIVDRNGIVLAENKPTFNLDITPNKSQNLAKTIAAIQQLITISDDQVVAFKKQLALHYHTEAIPLIVDLNTQQRAIISANLYHLPAVSIRAALMRYYPYGKTFAAVLGYVGRINQHDLLTIDKTAYQATNVIGKNGIEKQYEKQLHGKIGYQKVQINTFGKVIKTTGVIKPQSGSTLTLTLDAKLQQAAYNAFADDNGSAVAINPNNGDILALVSHPGFDPNLFVKGISQKKYQQLMHDPNMPLFNRALRGLYPMASTIKPFIALYALTQGLITAQFSLFDRGVFQLPHSQHIYHDWKRGGHGNINIARAIWVSCDTFFYYLANKIGITQIDNALRPYGIGQKPQIDLPYALAGTLPSPQWKEQHIGQPWYAGDTVISGIGQGYFQVSPLQLAVAAATLANGKTHYQPHLLRSNKALALSTIHSTPAARQLVLNAMQNVINNPEGTGFRFGSNPPFTVAAKTGTAQVVSRSKFNSFAIVPKNFRNHSLFIVFTPLHHAQIAVAVVAEHSKQAPAIARKIINAYYAEDNHATPKP